jgi:hypothetical protein
MALASSFPCFLYAFCSFSVKAFTQPFSPFAVFCAMSAFKQSSSVRIPYSCVLGSPFFGIALYSTYPPFRIAAFYDRSLGIASSHRHFKRAQALVYVFFFTRLCQIPSHPPLIGYPSRLFFFLFFLFSFFSFLHQRRSCPPRSPIPHSNSESPLSFFRLVSRVYKKGKLESHTY